MDNHLRPDITVNLLIDLHNVMHTAPFPVAIFLQILERPMKATTIPSELMDKWDAEYVH
jgi:hypothetical protein